MAIKVSFDRKRWQPQPVNPAVQETELPGTLPQQPVQPQKADVAQQPQETPQVSYVQQFLENNKKPEQEDYRSGADWLATLTPPLSDEEMERRRRSANAVAGIGHLGNLISAFANVIYTSKGALPLTIPSVPTGAVNQWEEKMYRIRQNYEAMRQKAAALDAGNYQNALKIWQKGYSDAVGHDQKADELRYKAWKDAVDAEDKAQGRLLERDRLDETKRHNEASEKTARQRVSVAMQNAKNGRTAGGSGKETIIRLPRKDGGYDEYKKSELDDETVASAVYSRLPEKYMVRDTKAIGNFDKETGEPIYPIKFGASKAEKVDAIMRAINDGVLDTFSDDIRVGTSQKQKSAPWLNNNQSSKNNAPWVK